MADSEFIARNGLETPNIVLGGKTTVVKVNPTFTLNDNPSEFQIFSYQLSSAKTSEITISANQRGVENSQTILVAHGGSGVSSNSITGAKSDALPTDAFGSTWVSRISNMLYLVYTYEQHIAYGASGWVACGWNYYAPYSTDDVYVTSTNGVTWTSRGSLMGTATNAITFGNGIYVAVGGSAGYINGRIKTSTDRITWTTQTSNFGTSVPNHVNFGNGIWVAVGTGGQMRTSTDAVTWATQTSNFGNTTITTVAYGNSLWVAGGASGQIRTSTDAVTWTTRTSNLGTDYVRTACFGNGVFVIGTQQGSIISSTDGTTWTTRTSNLIYPSTYDNINKIVYDGKRFILAASSGQMRTSTNGITWTTMFTDLQSQPEVADIDVDPSESVLTTIISPNYFQRNIRQLFYYTTTGATDITYRVATNQTWTTVTSNFGNTTIRSVAFGNGLWVAAGDNGQMRTSTDALTWVTRTSNFGSTPIQSIGFGNGIWVAAGSSGQIRTSTDAVTWTTQTSNFGASIIQTVKFGNGIWIAAGDTGQIRTSTDAFTWVTRTSNFGTRVINKVEIGAGVWVAVGGYAQIRSSTDGTTWTTRSIAGGTYGARNITELSFSPSPVGSRFYAAVGENGSLEVMRSTNGITWVTNLESDTVIAGSGVVCINGLWVCKRSNAVRTSTDTFTWTTSSTLIEYGHSGFSSLSNSVASSTAWGNGTWVMAIGGVLRRCQDADSNVSVRMFAPMSSQHPYTNGVNAFLRTIS